MAVSTGSWRWNSSRHRSSSRNGRWVLHSICSRCRGLQSCRRHSRSTLGVDLSLPILRLVICNTPSVGIRQVPVGLGHPLELPKPRGNNHGVGILRQDLRLPSWRRFLSSNQNLPSAVCAVQQYRGLQHYRIYRWVSRKALRSQYGRADGSCNVPLSQY
jgi:hypothetical protein